MALAIDELQIEIQANSAEAASGINSLTESLKKLQSAVRGGVGLTTTIKQLQTFSLSLKGMDIPAQKVSELTKALKPLTNMGKSNLGSVVNPLKKIPEISDKLNGSKLEDFANTITKVTDASKPLAQMAKSNFNSVLTPLKKIPEVTAGLDETKLNAFADSIAKVSEAAKPLSEVEKGGLGYLVNSLKKIPEIVKELDGTKLTEFSEKAIKVAEALKPLSEVGNNKAGSMVNSLKKIPEITAELDDTKLASFADAIKKVTDAVRPLATEMEKVSLGFSHLPANIQRAIKANEKLTTSNKKTAYGFNMIAAKIGIIFAATRKAASYVGGWLSESNDYVENLNLFNASMGTYAKDAQKYAEYVGDLLGIDPSAWMRNQGVFMTLATGFGVAADKSALMSKNLTQLGYDLSAFFNISVEDSMQKLQSGISGELEPLRRLGYDLSQAKLEAIALSKGIDKNVSSMTQAEKAQLRYYAILTQVTVAQGDMARTLDAPANQLRILKAQVTQTARALGDIFIPVLNKVMPYAIAFLKVVRSLANEFANFMGFTLPEVDYSGITQVGSSLEEAEESAKGLRRQLLGIDEINVLGTPTGIDSGGTGDGIDIDLPQYDFLKGVTESKVNSIAEEMERTFRDMLPLVTTIAGVLGTMWVVSTVDKFTTAVDKAYIAFQTLVQKGLSPVNKAIFGTAGIVAGFALATKGGKDLAKALSSDSKEGLNGAVLSLVGGVGLGIAGGAVVGGPIGALIGGLTALGGAIFGMESAHVGARYELSRTAYYDVQGEKIDNVRTALNKYFEAMDFGKQAEWIETIKISADSYETAQKKYDDMWGSIANKPVFDASDIENLSDAFRDLANAAKSVNDAKIGSLMSSIKTAIDMNITDGLTSRLGGLLSKIQEAQIILGMKIEGLSGEYQSILLAIKEQGGAATNEQIGRMSELRNEMTKFTLSDESAVAAEKWKTQMGAITQNGINAGSDQTQVKSNLESLIADRSSYISTLQDQYALDKVTLSKLIEINETEGELKGKLGVSKSDLKTLEAAFNAKMSEVYTQYNEVLTSLLTSYSDNVIDPKIYQSTGIDSWIQKNILDPSSAIAGGLLSLDPSVWQNYFADKKLSKEQQEILKLIQSKYAAGYATGGFPSVGELFVAREAGPEMVGTMGGRTTVANNDQIVEGIKRGVYEANMASQGNGGDITIQIVDPDGNVKHQTVVSAAERRNRRDGVLRVALQS